MDVIKFVLYVTTKLTLATIGAVVSLVVFLLEKLTGHALKRAQQPAPQQERPTAPPPVYQASDPSPTNAAPTVHVHVHLDQVQPHPTGTPTPSPQPAAPSPAMILNQPDHRIYVTTGSHLMQEHPACDDLLERLDDMLYVAAHRDGVPFTVAPPLDDAWHGRSIPLDLPPVASVDEGEFFSPERTDLPPSDGRLWLRKAGEAPQPLATGTPS